MSISNRVTAFLERAKVLTESVNVVEPPKKSIQTQRLASPPRVQSPKRVTLNPTPPVQKPPASAAKLTPKPLARKKTPPARKTEPKENSVSGSPSNQSPRSVRQRDTQREISTLLDRYLSTGSSHYNQFDSFINVDSKALQKVADMLETERKKTSNTSSDKRTEGIIELVKTEALKMDAKINALRKENEMLRTGSGNSTQHFIEKWAEIDDMDISPICQRILQEQERRLKTEEDTSNIIAMKEQQIRQLEDLVRELEVVNHSKSVDRFMEPDSSDVDQSFDKSEQLLRLTNTVLENAYDSVLDSF